MNYEFHVGDYVETTGGFVGWIAYVSDDGAHAGAIDKNGNIQTYCMPEEADRFVRIGAYDFTKKEKKNIEPISDTNMRIITNAIKPDNQLVRTVGADILDKINELVDAVNLLLDKSTES